MTRPVGFGLRILVLLAAISALAWALFGTCAHAQDPYTISDHPRLWLRNASGDAGWLDTLATRAQNSHSRWYNAAKDKIDNTGTGGKYWWRVMNDAFVGMLEVEINADSSYLNHAIDVLMYLARIDSVVVGDTAPYRFTKHDQSDMEMAETPQVILAYDWLYNYMTQAQRDTIGTLIGGDVDSRASGAKWNIIDDWGYPYLAAGGFHITQAMAVYGDSNCCSVPYSDSAGTYIWELRDRFTYDDLEYNNQAGFLSCADQAMPYGTQYGYFIKRAANLWAIPEMLRSTGDPVAYADSSSFLQNMATYQRFYFTACNEMPRNIGKINSNVIYCQAGPIYAWAGDRLSDTAAQYHANRIYDRTDDGDDCLEWDDNRAWRQLVWYKPWLDETAAPDSTSFYDQYNMVSVRDRWQWDDMQTAPDTSTVIQTDWYIPTCQSGAVASGHTTIQRGKDRLIWSKGQRRSDTDVHFYPYYMQSYNWSTVQILPMEGEDPGDITIVYCADPDSTVAVPDDGGQPFSKHHSNAYHACNDSVKAYLTFCGEEPMWGTWGGEFVAFQDTGRVVYARGNLMSAYTYDCEELRADNVVREWVFVRPAYPTDYSIMVVRDWITRAHQNSKTEARYHVLHQPVVSDTSEVTMSEGSAWSATGGGIYDMGSIRDFIIERGDSEAQAFVLKPSSDEGAVYVTGGPNRTGDSWKQNSWNTCANYDTFWTSYEFFIKPPALLPILGKNYAPAHSPAGRFNTGGDESSDWTITLQAPSEQGEAEAELLFALVVDAIGSTAANAEWQEGASENNLRVAVGDDITNIVFTPSGWFSRVVFGDYTIDPIHQATDSVLFVRSIETAKDTYIRQDSSYYEIPFGYSSLLTFSADTVGGDNVPIVQFNIPELYQGESFDSARIVVDAAASPLFSSTCRLYRLNTNVWDEALATWTHRTADYDWDAAGAWGSFLDTTTDYGNGANGIIYEWETDAAPPVPDSVTVARGSDFSDFIEDNMGSTISFIWHDVPGETGGLWTGRTSEASTGFGPTLRIYGQRPSASESSHRRRLLMYGND